jgi:hypothetical protein
MTPLADFGMGGSREAALRRSLHALHVRPVLIGAASAVAGRRRQQRARAFAERFAYWHRARTVLDRDSWDRLVHGPAILAYHAFGRPGEPAGRFIIPSRLFERQMAWLVRRGRPVIPLEEFVACRRDNRLPAAGSVVITLDDDYEDTASVAAPILKRQGLPATVFVVSSRVGATTDWDGRGELAGRPLLTWEALAKLRSDGISVGAHTSTHPILTELPAERVEKKLNGPGTPVVRLRRALIDGDASMLRFSLAVRFGDPDVILRPLRRLLPRRR